MAADSICRYCGTRAQDVKWAPLKCKVCSEFVHLSCIRSERPPACYGDRFFDFTCRFCSGTGSELCVREHMTWLQVVHLSVYHILMGGQGRKGYLHYSDNIGSFISSNWKRIVPYRKKTTAWISTIAGVLSSNCPGVFRSGTEELKEPGWWTLAEMKPPNPSQSLTKGSRRHASHTIRQQSAVIQSKSRLAAAKESIPSQKQSKQGISKRRGSHPVLSAKYSIDSIQPPQQAVVRQAAPPISKRLKIEPFYENAPVEHDLKQEEELLMKKLKELSGSSSSSKLKPLTERQEKIVIRHLSKMEDALSGSAQARQMLAKFKLRQRYRKFKVPLFDLDATVHKMLQTTKSYKIDPHDDSILLPVKYTQEEMQQNSPNLQNSDNDVPANSPMATFTQDYSHTARTSGVILSSVLPPVQSSFRSKLVASQWKAETFVSPYTKRVLKPIIWQDREVRPRRVRLLAEIQQQYAVRQCEHPTTGLADSRDACIAYCYLREHHVAAVNSLIANFFWTGVNVGECLEYPDFTVVAMHKKLVIGCGFLTPDVRVNEAYISFFLVHPDWQGCGIGSFMLYHLTQTCMGKDITLHVSVDNHAALTLYQKFGFKMEKLCLGFYERYYPANYYLSKHACLMRLKR